MKAFLGVLSLICALHCSSGFVVRSVKDGESELVAVAVLFRHGDKTPTTSFPNDPYFNLSYWPMGFGQLTKQGKKRHYELGKWLRKRYGSFLPEEYNAKDIYVLSSDVDRTLMSAQVNLAGLYPPKGSQMWNENIPWQPIPVHTLPNNEDQLIYMNRPCPRYNKLYNETYKSEFFVQIDEAYADFYKQVSNWTGWQIDDVHFFAQLQSVLYVYSIYNSTYLPPWAANLDQDKLNYLAGLNYARYTFTDELKKLGDGPFFDHLFGKLDKVLGKPGSAPKFLMYSGHESNLASVLNGMGVFDNRAPEFASCLIWEVRKNADGEQFVNLFYKKNSADNVEQLKLNGCELNCRYEIFKSLLAPFTIDLPSWDAECVKNIY